MGRADNIMIRSLESVKELEKVRELESLIWSSSESTPSHQTLTAVKNGGMVIGAFSEGGELIGFQYSFPGFDGENVYLCSHILGIHPEFQKLGIGEKLKTRQKEVAIEKGYERIVWTYDPLETVNGHLNLHKLGAVCSTYIENCYGEMDDALNQGMPSDRFLVEWRIKDERNRRNIKHDDHPYLIRVEKDAEGFLVPVDMDVTRHEEKGLLLVPVPSNFQQLKKMNADLALSWRMNSRHVFLHYFHHGWSAVDLIRSPVDSALCFYILECQK
ncbi:GNAT family N-acetyltransferase [Fictibacillus sp. Mic-4]|uniref:GNAT family N-acetyltransferase n=1 Tax=Fictibacillus TaxID=1329200 RepID=UPI00040A14D7|nr:GNAT family N-acetyltransferase [Fictibacillus gelatini]